MRVIAGKYGSRKLQTLRGLALRPSSDRLRETLFNILGPAAEGAVFVDLFAGSGAVGIEALSRGAHQAIFVENHVAGAALLRRNLSSLGVEPGGAYAAQNGPAFGGTAEVLVMDAVAALEQLVARGTQADFVFVDPPYADTKAYDAVLSFLGEPDLLRRDGRVIVEHGRRWKSPALVGELERIRVVEQGDTTLSFYRLVLAA